MFTRSGNVVFDPVVIHIGVEFQFRWCGGLFNHQLFKDKTPVKTSIVHDLLFVDGAVLVDTSIEEAEDLINRFFHASKPFSLNINSKRIGSYPSAKI